MVRENTEEVVKGGYRSLIFMAAVRRIRFNKEVGWKHATFVSMRW